MQPKIILGYSENVLSMVLETLKANGETGPFQIIQNIAVEDNGKISFIPPCTKVSVIHVDEISHLDLSHKCIFGVLSPVVKKQVFNFFYKEFGVAEENYINLIHPSSHVADTAKMKEGCYIEPLTVVSPFSDIGFGVSLNRGVTIGHHAVLSDFVSINPGVHIAGHACIGENTTIGIGAVVFDHIRIGENCKIGGGSVVTKDIPDNVIAWGNPCKIIKTIGDE